MEHFTNIHGVEFLAQQHPLVESVQQHNPQKLLGDSTFNKVGRCTKPHQSPWGLKLTLAASDAQMIAGVSANGAANGSENLY